MRTRIGTGMGLISLLTALLGCGSSNDANESTNSAGAPNGAGSTGGTTATGGIGGSGGQQGGSGGSGGTGGVSSGGASGTGGSSGDYGLGQVSVLGETCAVGSLPSTSCKTLSVARRQQAPLQRQPRLFPTSPRRMPAHKTSSGAHLLRFTRTAA